MGATLAELARLVHGQVRGVSGFIVERANSLEHAGPRDIAFFVGARYRKRLAGTGAGAIVLTDANATGFPGNVLMVENPALAFAVICAYLHPTQPNQPGAHASAVINAAARVASTASVGPGAIVDADTAIADAVQVGPGCVIGRNVSIGARTQLRARVTIQDDCVIGSDCLIHSGVVIGADGFGFARDGSRWIKQPQYGRVVIGSAVEIGANSTIDRGTFGDTVIGDGVKMDNQVHIAHNVRVGDDCAIAAYVGIAGSAVIGKRCTLAGRAGIVEHLEIADDVHITATSLVTNSIVRSGAYSSSLKAEPIAQWRRNAARLQQLDELARRLRRLEQQLEKEGRRPPKEQL